MEIENENKIQPLIDAAMAPPPAEESPAQEEKQENKPESITARTIEKISEVKAKEGEDKSASNFSLSKTLGGVIIARAIQKQIWLVLLITGLLLIYITNRYTCQKQSLEISRLEDQLTAMRYKATVCTSLLTEKSRESNIINMLMEKGDSTLTIPNEPPYLIKVK